MAAMTRPWYRRFPDNFIAGTVGLTLEEKGAYSLVLDLMYVRGGPVPDEPRYIAGVCNCSVRKWNAIRDRLVGLGKIHAVDGYLTNDRATKEIENAAKDARELAENGSKGGYKAAENARAANKNKTLASAKPQHARATLLQNSVKESAIASLGSGSEAETVVLDRWSNEDLFHACEQVTGQGLPSEVSLQRRDCRPGSSLFANAGTGRLPRSRGQCSMRISMGKPFTIGERFIFGINLEKPRDWRDGAYNLAEWKAWDRAQRTRLGFFSGLKFWGTTNTPGSRVLLSRHWPHRLCWDWSIWVGLHRGADWDGPLKVAFIVSRKYRNVNISLLWFKLNANWQNYQHMAGLGPIGRGAPSILWNHHLEHAEPAGRA
jgi:uncharacterized protein YdaU (DUF1376 family)